MQNSAASAGTVIGTSPSGQTVPGIIVTLVVSNGVAPPPPPPPSPKPARRPLPPPLPGMPPGIGTQIVEIPGLPPITVPVLAPPPLEAPCHRRRRRVLRHRRDVR